MSLCGLAALGLLSYGGKHNMVIDDAGSGKFIHYESFPSDLVEPRPVDVWLPKNYGQSDDRYPVIYMHDGQFTFDRPTSPYTSIWERIKGSIYGGLFWDVDKTMVRLIAKKQIRPAIVVSIWNLPKGRRRTEYMPQKPVTEEVDKLIQTQSDISLTKITSDNYLKFLVSELKPFIDSTYLTKPDADNTLIFGSSMGGMISAYAISEYPEVFGAAACLSTHWSTGGDAIIDWYEDHWPTAGKHRLYFDYGTKSLDADYEPFQKKMDALMLKKGYRDNKDWVTRRFEDASHTPKAWRERLHVPLIFLLGS
mgnify:CR=1 FL=1